MILLTSAKMPDGLDKEVLAETVRLLFPNEKNQEYIANIEKRAEIAATESLFALALLYELIRSLPTKRDTSDLVFARSHMGKPYFENSDVRFNVSHSKGYVAVAVSVGEELGVDVEATNLPHDRALKMAERYFSESERQQILREEKSFADLWSEKEAKAKLFGESIGNMLSKEKKESLDEKSDDVRIHSFSIDEFPVSLCTKRNFSTIVYTVQ